jgi:hypothetical protein
MKQLEFKGTKGEWNVRDNFRKPSILNESNQVLAMLSINCFDDKDGLHKYYSHNKMMANAKLIAAAPELLKALIKSVESMKLADEVEFRDEIKQAEQAINKALK